MKINFAGRFKRAKIVRWFGTHPDTDDQKQIEAELRSTNQRLDMALEAAGLGEWELNFKTRTATRSLRHCQIFGYESAPPGWSSEMFVQHVLPEQRAEVAEKVAASHLTGSLEFETQIRRADGEVRWIWVRGRHVPDETGNPARMYGTVMDITDRKRAEEALKESEAHLRWRTAFFEAQLDSSPDGILVTDDHGDAIYKNRRFVQMWNMPEELFNSGMSPQRLAFAVEKVKSPSDYAESTVKIFASSDWAGHEEVEFLDGTFLTRFTSPVNDASGKHFGRVWVFQDVTRRRQMEQQLRQSQKMEAVGQLTGGIAHDFNNLLGIILGNLDLLHEQVADNKPALRRVETAQKAAERGADVTRRLLAFSRSGELKPELTHLNLIVREVVDLARTLGPDIKFATHLDEAVTPILVDTAGFESALLNLFVNSRDAMPNGGSLTISTELRALDESHPLVEIGELASTTYACISVTDTGSGMSAETLNRVFEPFFTTKSEGKGTGLGLAMVYGFVKQSGGAVRLYSEEGIGTTVTVYLPLADAILAQPTADAATPPPLPSLSKVLVVDDEPDLLEITRVYLEQMGYEVYEAKDAAAALDVARHHPDIDLMITDVIMPGGVNGVELAYNIRELFPHIKIIYTSGFPANAMADRGLPGIDGPMLRKPYHLAEFEAAIRMVME